MLMNVGRVFRDIAIHYGDRPALINIERDRRFTYGALRDISNRVCNFLKRRFHMKGGDFYATVLENDNMGLFHPWMLKSPVGGVWIDVRESLNDVIERIGYTEPKVVFMENRFLPQLYEHCAGAGIDMVLMDPVKDPKPGVHYYWDLVDEASAEEVDEEFVIDDTNKHISVLRFTGGTTGQPKCAMYSFSNLWTWGCNPAHYFQTFPYDHPAALLFSPIHHAASGSIMIPVHIKGGAIVTLNKADIEDIGRAVEKEKIDMIYTVPTVLYRMLDHGAHKRFDLSSLKTIRYGAAPISPAKLEAVLEIFGHIFVQGYGATECWPSCTILGREDHRTDNPESIKRLASIGRPFPGQEILICNDQGEELPAGEQGELWIRGANTVGGYYKAEELTRENFTPNGFWKSGDIGYMDEEGYVFLVDRKKDLIISGGYNVYSTEVENCLNSHPAVNFSAVVGLPDQDWGEAVNAAVVLKQGRSASAEELIGYCKERLARYKTPKNIQIVRELPLSPAGKVLRRKVRDAMLEG